MPKRNESLLEKLKLGQQGWNEVLSRNAQRLNDILLCRKSFRCRSCKPCDW